MDNSTTHNGDRRAVHSRSIGRQHDPARGEGAAGTVGSAPIVPATVASAIQLARQRLATGWPAKHLLGWNERGYWRDSCDAGPAVTALVAVVLKFIGQLD